MKSSFPSSGYIPENTKVSSPIVTLLHYLPFLPTGHSSPPSIHALADNIMGFPPPELLNPDGSAQSPTNITELVKLLVLSQWKLADFGLSFMDMSAAHEPCSLVGTPWYAAPEVYLHLNQRSLGGMRPKHSPGMDMWSMAVTGVTCRCERQR